MYRSRDLCGPYHDAGGASSAGCGTQSAPRGRGGGEQGRRTSFSPAVDLGEDGETAEEEEDERERGRDGDPECGE